MAPKEHLALVGREVVDPFEFRKVNRVVEGGNCRHESVCNGLEALPAAAEFAAIHDGARPLTASKDIDRVVEAAKRQEAAMLAVPAIDTLKRVRNGVVKSTVDREEVYLAQTPQVFRRLLIPDAHRRYNGSQPATDDASLVEQIGVAVHVVEPTGCNMKVTTADDLLLIEALLRREEDA